MKKKLWIISGWRPDFIPLNSMRGSMAQWIGRWTCEWRSRVQSRLLRLWASCLHTLSRSPSTIVWCQRELGSKQAHTVRHTGPCPLSCSLRCSLQSLSVIESRSAPNSWDRTLQNLNSCHNNIYIFNNISSEGTIWNWTIAHLHIFMIYANTILITTLSYSTFRIVYVDLGLIM